NAKVPAGAVRVDGRGLHVYPGLIDAGSQLGLSEFGQVPQATDARENGQFNPDLKAVTAVQPESVNFPKVRYNGITTTMVFPQGGEIPGQSGIIRTIGPTNEMMRIDESFGLVVGVPSSPNIADRYRQSPDEFSKSQTDAKDRRAALKERFETAKRYLAAKDAGERIPTDIKQEAMRPYVTGQKPVLLYATNEGTIRWAISFAKEMKLKAILVGANDAWRMTREVKASGYPVLVNPPVAQCPGEDTSVDEFDPYDTSMAFAALLDRANIPFAFASGDWETAMNLPLRAGRACAFGLRHARAMYALTLGSAKILGIDKEYGSLETGKVANVIVTDGDPLEVTTSLRYLFIDGKPVPLVSHYTE
ncbi:hypothetical protein EON81_29345, partial [bacterium]